MRADTNSDNLSILLNSSNILFIIDHHLYFSFQRVEKTLKIWECSITTDIPFLEWNAPLANDQLPLEEYIAIDHKRVKHLLLLNCYSL